MNAILIIAHTPLASALRACVLHVFPDTDSAGLLALDVLPDAAADDTLAQARLLLSQLDGVQTLVLTDVFGATPCNVAQQLVDGTRTRLVAGVNLPMLLRTVCYRHEALEVLVARALVGGTQGVMQVATTAPQNQTLQRNDQNPSHHQQ